MAAITVLTAEICNTDVGSSWRVGFSETNLIRAELSLKDAMRHCVHARKTCDSCYWMALRYRTRKTDGVL